MTNVRIAPAEIVRFARPIFSPGIAGHSIFTHAFGRSRPVFDTPNETGNDGGVAAAEAARAAAAESARVAAAAAEAAKAKPAVSDDAAQLLKEVMKQKEEIRVAKEALKAFEGLDPAAARKAAADAAAAEAERVKAEEENALKRGEFDRIKGQMADSHKAELEAERALVKAEQDAARAVAEELSQARQVIDNLTVGQAFDGSVYVRDNLVLTPKVARTVFGAHFDVENGVTIPYDKPRGAKDRTKLVDGSGNSLTFEVALQKLVETNPEKDQLLRSKQLPGAGSKTIDTKVFTPPKDGLRGMARIEANLGNLKQMTETALKLPA